MDHYLALPWGKRFEARSVRAQYHFSFAPNTIASKANLDRVDQVLVAERLGQELNGTALHRLHAHRDVTVRRYEDDWNLDIGHLKLALKIQAARPGQPDIEDEANGTFRDFRFAELGNRGK